MIEFWKDRIIPGVEDRPLPLWVERAYAAFSTTVTHPAYPCFFGKQAELRGEMFYTYVEDRFPNSLINSLATFVRLGARDSFSRYNFVAFFEPINVPRSHSELEARFWNDIQTLLDADPFRKVDGQRLLPDDPEWEFSYHGSQMFVVVGSPTYVRRRSRNLGPGIVLLFQPRAVFVDKVTNEQISASVRGQIRERLWKWDWVPPHPDLGLFGDPNNREWKQYCLPDDNAPETRVCPLSLSLVRSDPAL